MNEERAAAEWVEIESLFPWDENPRENEEAAVEVAKSIERFGWGAPIVARREDQMIIAGHTRLKAAKLLGLKTVPVRFVDLDPVDAKLLALADNKVGEIAEWSDGLGSVLKSLDNEGVDLDGIGFSEDELLELLAEEAVPIDSDKEEEIAPLPEDPESEPGVMYELGPHRLICGDSTDPQTWQQLMEDHDGAHAIWTDPPYGISYVGGTSEALTIKNDDIEEEGLEVLLRSSIGEALNACKPGAAIYVAAPAGVQGVVFAVVLKSLEVFKQRLVWVKDTFALGRSDYHYRHEDIYYGYHGKPESEGRQGRLGTIGWHGDHKQSSVLEFPKPRANREHPTMKPIELIARCLENSTGPGMTVIDPFGGSGSTLIAAASLGRECRTIELDPRYCDVIRRRWTAWAKKHNRDAGSGALE